MVQLIASLFLLLPVAFAALPNGWKACSRSANDYENCLAKQINFAVSTVINGDKKLGILPVDPLKVNHIEIPKRDGPVSLSFKLDDILVKGFKDSNVISVKNDWKKSFVEAYVPKMTVNGDYKMDGKVLVLPIVGDGKANLVYDKMNVTLDIVWKRIEKGGKSYFQMEKCTVELKPKKFIVHYENLFNGNKQLADTAHTFLNENWQDILKEMKGPISQTLSKVVLQIANSILLKIPADEIDVK